MIGVVQEGDDFTSLWIAEMKKSGLEVVVLSIKDKEFWVNARKCSTVFWHFSQTREFDIKWARSFLEALSSRGIKTLPDRSQSWHFDNKISQFYLLEGMGYDIPPTQVFFRWHDFKKDVSSIKFPVIMKFHGGAGSQNVIKITSKIALYYWALQAFTIGIAHHRPLANFFLNTKRPGRRAVFLFIKDLLKFILPSKTERIFLREKGYLYLQEFIPEAKFDIRIITIGDKAFGIKRFTGEKDFRASGSGVIDHDVRSLPPDCVGMSFDLSDQFNFPWMTYDWIYHKDKGKYLLVEISYGFHPSGYTKCNGYFTRDLEIQCPMFNIYSEMINVALD